MSGWRLCSFYPCGPDVECVLVGGCLKHRFGDASLMRPNHAPPDQKAKHALAGTKPARKDARKPRR